MQNVRKPDGTMYQYAYTHLIVHTHLYKEMKKIAKKSGVSLFSVNNKAIELFLENNKSSE